jgi:hypothetical protein
VKNQGDDLENNINMENGQIVSGTSRGSSLLFS